VEREESFGVIPLSRVNGNWHVFLIQHKGGRYWGFPKGHAEMNESHRVSAERELKEETNLEIARYLQDEPFIEQYTFMKEGRRVFKQVFYFAAEVQGEIRLQVEEINDGMWLPFHAAMEKVTHQEGKNILHQVSKLL
jgi:bis(5'-nucleosidyl)-tetraphosphatase